MSVYVPRYNLLFVHPPKTGGTSVQEWLLTNVRSAERTKNSFQHVSLETLIQEFNFEDPFSFATVRNPFDRVVSSYFYHKEVLQHHIEYLKTHPNQEGGKFGNLEKNIEELNACNNGLKYYIENIMKLKPQVEYTKGVSLIIKLEEINQKFTTIQKLVKCRTPLQHLNTSKHEHYTAYYDKKTKKLVSRIFYEDLIEYGYEYGN